MGTGIALVSLVISLVAMTLAVRSDRRAKHAENRDEERIGRERREASDKHRARLAFSAHGGSGGPAAEIATYDFHLRNLGGAPAQGLTLLVKDADGNVRGGWDSTYLPTGDEAQSITIEVAAPRSPDMQLWAEWLDDEGNHSEDTGMRLPAHH